MRACLTTFVLLLGSLSASANTLVIVFRTEQASIIAADSKVSTEEGFPLGSVCKIHIANDLVWATTGAIKEFAGPFDLWQIVERAISAGGNIDDVVTRFENDTLTQLKELLVRIKASHPQNYLASVKTKYPVTSVFIRGGDVRATYFFLPNSDFPEQIEVVRHRCPSEEDCPTGQLQLMMGEHEAVDGELKASPRLFEYSGLIGGLDYLVDVQHNASPNTVGPPTSILRVDKSGALTWLQKGECN